MIHWAWLIPAALAGGYAGYRVTRWAVWSFLNRHGVHLLKDEGVVTVAKVKIVRQFYPVAVDHNGIPEV